MSHYDEAWLRARGYRMVGDTAARLVQDVHALLHDGSGPDTDIPEGTLLAQVRRLALDHGFLFYHTYSSRRSDPGYLDCTLTKPGHPLYIWELKSTHGKLTLEQARWVRFLQAAPRIEAAVYWPKDLPTITALLTRRGQP
jgi:hypothetical protein